jgi:hypothetical protein
VAHRGVVLDLRTDERRKPNVPRSVLPNRRAYAARFSSESRGGSLWLPSYISSKGCSIEDPRRTDAASRTPNRVKQEDTKTTHALNICMAVLIPPAATLETHQSLD